jgi:hypothetical protein
VTEKRTTYKVISVSVYAEDLKALDGKVALLKKRGLHKMNRSRLLRIAVRKLDAESVMTDDE